MNQLAPGARAALLALASLLVIAGCDGERPKGDGAAATLFDYCSPCHGDDGSGKPEYAAPAIAGLQEWYVKNQLDKFRTGLRGAHPDDVAGLRMRPMARSLADDAVVAELAAYVASLPGTDPAPTLTGGDPQNGRNYFASCAACHGVDGRGSQKEEAPSLLNLDDWYLLAQLKKMKAGVRGANPQDLNGLKMRPFSMSLPTEQAMLDVVAYIQTLD